MLLAGRQAGIERQDVHLLAAVPQGVGDFVDLALAGEEHQHVATAFALQLVDGGFDGFRQGLFAGVGVGARKWRVADVYRVAATGDFDNRRVIEMFGNALGIDGGRGNDEFEVAPLAQQLFQIAEQEVNIEAALVRFVDGDGVVLVEPAVMLGLGQQNAVGHHLDVTLRAHLVGEADFVADLGAQLGFQLLGDASCNGAGRQTPWLGMADHAVDAAAHLHQDLRQLRGLAGAGLATNQHHLMLLDRAGDLVAFGADGEGFGVTDVGQVGQS